MPYVIRKTDGTTLLIIDDGIVDTSIGLNLVGRSFTGYGELLAENFVHLAEHFASNIAPANPVTGQIWYDTSQMYYKYWTGEQWQNMVRQGPSGPSGPIGPTGFVGSRGSTGDPGELGYTGSRGFVGSIGYSGSRGESSFTWGPIAPVLPTVGDRWFDSLSGAELVWVDDGNSTQWVEVSASGFLGQTGYTGSAGTAGPAGGYTGSQGASGFVGSQGVAGFSGSRGLVGFTGSVGATGPANTSQREVVTDSTQSLANNETANLTFSGFKTYSLLKVQTSTAARIRIYVDSSTRAADADRLIGEDPQPTDGVIAEIITTGAQTVRITPAIIGFSDNQNIELAVTNLSGTSTSIIVALTLLKLEN